MLEQIIAISFFIIIFILVVYIKFFKKKETSCAKGCGSCNKACSKKVYALKKEMKK